MYKIKVFISSSVDEEADNVFSEMRKKITRELEGLGLFNVYIYERGYSTSKNVIDDYLDEIPDSHICLFLINSAEGVVDGVQKEITLSKKLDKPQIYIFNHADTKDETPLEKELKNPQGSRVKIINTFDEFYDESIKSIKSEIVKIYKDYSSGRLVRAKEEQQSSIDLKLSSLTETDLEKSYIKGFEQTKQHLSSFMGTEPRNFGELTSNNLDEHTISFFDVLIRNKDIKEFNTTFYLDELKKWHRKEVYEVIQFRWRAIEYYFSGDLEKCIENLKVAYEKAIRNELAPWLIQDILIDLRNKNSTKYSNQNKYETEPVYQKLLTKSKEVLTYPVIDRLNNELLKRIEKKRTDELFKKPHSVNHDNILSEYAGILTSIYVVAAHYGSLTHLELMINKFHEVYFHLVENYSNWEFKIMLLKTTAYLTNTKDMERILRIHNNILAQINSKDVEEILLFSRKHPNKITEKKNELLVLSHLGYYLEDNIYDNYKTEIEQDFYEWINNPNKNIVLGSFYFKYMKGNIERLNQNKVVQFANTVYSYPMARFYNQFLEVLKEVNFKMVETDELKKLLKNLNRLLEEKNLDRFDYLRIALIGIYQGSLKDETDEIANKYLPELEKVLYLSDVHENQESPYQIYLKSFRILEKSNKQVENGVSFSGGGYNHYLIIKSVIPRIDMLTEIEVNNLNELLVRIVVHENQEPDAKVSAFQLMIYLKNNVIRFSNMDAYYEKIVKSDHSVLNVREGLMFNHSSLVVSFNYALFKSLFSDSDSDKQLDYQFISDVTSADTAEKLGFSVAIRNYLLGNKTELDPIVIHLLFMLKSDKDEQVRVNCLFGLINLISNHENENILIEISKMMDTETTLIKNIILRNIDLIKEKDSEIAQYILQKGRIDSHYLIRKQVQQKLNQH